MNHFFDDKKTILQDTQKKREIEPILWRQRETNLQDPSKKEK